jgi:hypothetical protein
VTGDTVYGGDRSLRVWLQQHAIRHVLAVKRTEPLLAMTDRGPAQVPAEQPLGEVGPEQWLRLSAGQGSKGKRLYDWVRVPLYRFGWPANVGFWLLARRSITEPDEVACYVCFAPADTSLATLVRVAGCRWRVEEAFEQAKGEAGLDHYQVGLDHYQVGLDHYQVGLDHYQVGLDHYQVGLDHYQAGLDHYQAGLDHYQVGLDHYQVRLDTAWYRHITLAMTAHAFLAVTRAQVTDPTAGIGGCRGDRAGCAGGAHRPELRRLLVRLAWRPSCDRRSRWAGRSGDVAIKPPLAAAITSDNAENCNCRTKRSFHNEPSGLRVRIGASASRRGGRHGSA